MITLLIIIITLWIICGFIERLTRKPKPPRSKMCDMAESYSTAVQKRLDNRQEHIHFD